MKELYRIIFKFLTRDIWRLDFSEFGKARRRAIRYLKALIITFRGFSGQRIAREAVALSYFGLMAIVPIVALILFVASGFGLDKMLYELLYSSFPNSSQMIDAVLNFANNIMDKFRGICLAGNLVDDQCRVGIQSHLGGKGVYRYR
ncbi:MAG TPA: hypothetical protein PLI69_06115 [Bacteroidales bacterium]|nr:hypothetical protein [Bacteroidales bacterium]